jgi:hypothetical protein
MGTSASQKARAVVDEAFLEHVLSFDGTSLRFESGFEITVEISQCSATPDRPHGFEYAFALIGPDRSGRRVRLLGMDNAHAGKGADRPFDHEHRERRTKAGYLMEAGPPIARPVTNVQAAIANFLAQAYDLLNREGVNTGAAQMEQANAANVGEEKRATIKAKQAKKRER